VGTESAARRLGATASTKPGELVVAGLKRLSERFGFTPMETIVALALAEGLTYKEIARRYRISFHTVHTHVKALHEKAGVTSNGRRRALIYSGGSANDETKSTE
jgi:DNA-binding CsgD family transcriptional regulator